MAWTKQEYAAVGWFAQQYNLVPQLSTYPTIYFKQRDGTEVKHQITEIVAYYLAGKKEEARERARARKVEKASKAQGRRFS